ncbi:MAG TPA: (2Fe-2S)-binding protein [Stellaceae bacterium]|nr:(2Fe-2S)-binding protein [Stellaceae bacterium]
MFHNPPDPSAETVEVEVEGQWLRVDADQTAAGAALLAGLDYTRTSPATGEKRAPYCLMGVCFECLMIIDGVPSRQACLTRVRQGMRIARQHGVRGLS